MKQKINKIEDGAKVGAIAMVAIASVWCLLWAVGTILLLIILPIWAIFTQ